MAELIYPTFWKDPGPWLISEESLLSLDKILDEEWKILQEERDSEISALVEAELQEASTDSKAASEKRGEAQSAEYRDKVIRRNYELGHNSRSIEIKFIGGKSLKVASFAEATRTPAVDGEEPLSVVVQLRCGRVSGELEIESEQGVKLDVSPQTNPVARGLYSGLRRWTQGVAPPIWIRQWTQWGLHLNFPIIILLLCFFAAAVNHYTDSSRLYKRDLRQLLADGLDQSKELKAVTLMAAIQSEADYPSPQDRISARLLIIAGFFLLTVIVLAFAPRTRIGLGLGRSKVQFWQWWSRAMMITIPATLFTTFAWPWIVDLIKAIF